MDLLIEKELLKNKSHIIEYATLLSILRNLGYENINDKILNLKQKGMLKSLKKGFYIHTSVTAKNIVSKECISNVLLDAPSYISLDYALSFYNFIPEAVHEITAVTTKRTKSFKTDFGVFSYQTIKKELFALGLKTETSATGSFLIASPAKALCDKIFLSKGIAIGSVQSLYEYLENDLRIDTDELQNIDLSIVQKYYELSKSKKIHLLLNLLKKL